ncbi:hypothetical protein [Candidatus Mycoplasma haematominutum]|uniref:hypothetical protein n=1 Tax=Candidatus Mycoplasma haematominutum TaxID=209446 RepID=UPI0002E3C6A0|nr:hypothetical protein [Candidatus Mycoplasma haematominutum]
MEINTEQRGKVKSALSKYARDLPNFKVAREYIQKNWESSKPNERTRRSINARQTPDVLDLEKRKSLSNLYRGVSQLFRDREKLNNKLSKESGSSSNLSVSEGPNSGEVERSLQRIGWEVQRELDIKSKRNKPHSRANQYGWISWTQNPYNLFFESETDFLALVQKVGETETALAQYLSSKRAAGTFALLLGPDTVNSVYRDKHKYENAVSTAKSDISIRVGAKLLIWMNQLKKESSKN